MEHRLHRLGWRDDIAVILNEIDILVHPARQEPLGRVLLEAASCARPIVATRVGGTEEILTDGISAILVPARTPAALAAGMHRVLSDRSEAQRLGAAARAQVVAKFNIRNTAPRLLTAWREAARPI